MKLILEFAKSHKKLSLGSCLILLALLWFAISSLRQFWHSHSINKQDEQIQKSIDANSKAAEASETNANTHRDEREKAEGRVELAEEQRRQAAENSNRTLDPVRKARQKHEEVRKSRPADYPGLSDDELCAELAKRGIACR